MLPDNPKAIELIMTLPTVTKLSSSYVQQRLPILDNDHIYTNDQDADFNQLSVENIMPGIYLTKNFTVWSEDKLRSHGFTHVIVIDKHIQDLCHPSVGGGDGVSVFNLPNATISIDEYDDHNFSHILEYDCIHSVTKSLNFGKEFEVIDLNFGEKSYLTTVLPNCYKAVKFINKALQSGGTILIIDCNGGEQKCLTITVAYLMYKNHLSFCDAFKRLKGLYKEADLDKFYVSQLYEYEPILQVQRAQSRGHSCSREMYAAILKRKKLHEDYYGDGHINNINNTDFLNQTHLHHSLYKSSRSNFHINNSEDFAME